jgi:carbamoyltransferase
MGPRALGARSILGDPRSLELRDKINLKVKNREFFRPFAPSVLAEEAKAFFRIPRDLSSPFMLVTFEAIEEKRRTIPGVVHVDGSARLQTVSKEDNPRYHKLLQCFHKRTGIPIVLNTSFNRAGEPIVNSPEDALSCFLRCGLDALVMEDYLVFSQKEPL